MATNYYCIRMLAVLEDRGGLVFDNYAGGRFPKFRTRREAVAFLRLMAADMLGSIDKVEAILDWRHPGEVKGIRFTDGFTSYIADIFRHDSAHIKGAGALTPEDMGVKNDGRATRTWAFDKFIEFAQIFS